MIYNISGQPIDEVWNYYGSSLSQAYDLNGNQLLEHDPYLQNRLLIFEDDFTGNTLNPENWDCEIGHVRGKSFETKWPDNVQVNNGKLVLTESKEQHTLYEDWPTYGTVTYEWAAGSIFSRGRKKWVYGRFEAKMKLSPVFNCAFWFMGNSFRQLYIDKDGSKSEYNTRYAGVENINNWAECGEIDVCESWDYTQKTNPMCNLWSNTGTSISSAAFPQSIDSVNEWHIYAIEKTPEYIAAFIDNVEYKRWTYSDYNSATVSAYVDKAVSIILSIGIGNENDINRGITNAKMYVDWIRVYAPSGVLTPIPAESISIQSALSLPVGYRTYMNPIIMPLTTSDMTVTWESDDDSIVRVEYGGYVFAEAIGETDIYAISANGLKAKCHVTVTAE